MEEPSLILTNLKQLLKILGMNFNLFAEIVMQLFITLKESRYNADFMLVKYGEREGTLQEIYSIDDWHVKYQAAMKLLMDKKILEEEIKRQS